ncbi:hypothetical protein CSUNSWCD_825 [Campylobacter showae CSUNSWCD]|uniref:Uncharacterized protein n=1 Tax=Campylobacter showae CSUNSWCD TaxID=1244083 RepID=M5INQ6_9BACT|nr:hypothetical protein CSUNSWCD_825 [Campylobacter showae CSUNSWCD]
MPSFAKRAVQIAVYRNQTHEFKKSKLAKFDEIKVVKRHGDKPSSVVSDYLSTPNFTIWL